MNIAVKIVFYRIMSTERIRSQRGYKRHPGFKGGKPAHIAPNTLNREFVTAGPNQVWATDIT